MPSEADRTPAASSGAVRSDASGGRGALALGIMLASGFAGLGYQIVWTQRNALWLGHEAAAVLAVVGAFFGGIAIGAFALGTRIDRSDRPERWYAACEVVIAVWSLTLAFAAEPATSALLEAIGPEPSPWRQWLIAFAGTLLLLLPATAAMGATLPAMERIAARLGNRTGVGIAALYAANTLGAVVGVLCTALWLIPAVGLSSTAAICTGLNLGCAALAMLLVGHAGVSGTCEQAPADPGIRAGSPPALQLARLAATGLLGIGYEVLVVRVLSEVAENTVYTFALLLAIYLIGTAIGAAAYARVPWTSGDDDAVRDRLLRALAIACIAGTAVLYGAETIAHTVAAAARAAFGSGMAAALSAETALAVAAFLAPTVIMGALFSHLAVTARRSGIGLGSALGANTLGAAIAPAAFGVVLLPALGPKLALLVVAAGYLALSRWRRWPEPLAWAGAGAIAVLAAVAPPLAFVEVPEGGRIVSYEDGAMAAVSVVEDAAGVARLRIDNRQQEGSSATVYADARQAIVPLLLHPAPHRALFLGLGTGVTASAAARDPGLEVDAVELLPEVVSASRAFHSVFADETPNSRLHVRVADARRYVRASPIRYDLIVSDNFHPARSGSGALYTAEHFAAVRARLAAGGIFVQWLPLHQLDTDTLRSIVAAFLTAYPDGGAVLATYSLETPVIGLVGRADDGRFAPGAVRERIAGIGMQPAPADFGLADEFAVLGSFVAGPRALARFALRAPVNTDDHPVVAYRAPRITYAPDSRPRDRLLAILRELEIAPGELIESRDPSDLERLAAYRRARDEFLVAGRDVQPTADVRALLAQVRAPLIAALRTSPDFRPAYDPLLRMAATLARIDPPAARELLGELVRLQPDRPDASQVLDGLAAAPR